MTDKSHKIAKLLLAAGGTAIGVFLIAKYHKDILRKWKSAKNVILHDIVKVQRTNFKVEIINDSADCRKIIESLREHCKEFPAIGFDCEWVTVNNERRKVALIQLCSSQGLCALIRVCRFKDHKIPSELREFLEDPEIIKAGVTPYNDAKLLLEDYAISMYGTFDLRFLALLANQKAEGLGKLSKSILDIELDKNWRIRCSDWEIEHLSPQQLDYAAKDAFVAVEIFRKLYNSVRPTANDSDSIRQFCDNYTDITFSNKLAQLNLDPATPSASSQKLLNRQNLITKFNKRSYATRTTPLYDNCQLEAPDGELLCTCDRKKAEWYVRQSLGQVVSDDPVFTVRLNFEPAGRAVGDVGEFYRTPKQNICVVCGQTEELIRKNVVPHEYRKFFPNVMKDKTSHDVLLLCSHCHQISNMLDLKMRRDLEAKCDAPMKHQVSSEVLEASRKLISEHRTARALLTQNKIPENRRQELHEVLRKSYPDDEINNEFLVNLLAKEVPTVSSAAPPHGEVVVQKYKDNEGLVELEQLWRQHFLQAMKPKFMPEKWDVNHNGNRLEIRATEGRVEAGDLKMAGVEAVIVPKIVATSETVNNGQGESSMRQDEEDVVDTSSEWEFRSAVGSVNSSRGSKVDLDRTLTEDDRFFSDSASARSFYETIRSDGSTLDDFQSFASSFTERAFPSSEGSRRSSFGSQDLSIDSDTEVEDDQIGKMEM